MLELVGLLKSLKLKVKNSGLGIAQVVENKHQFSDSDLMAMADTSWSNIEDDAAKVGAIIDDELQELFVPPDRASADDDSELISVVSENGEDTEEEVPCTLAEMETWIEKAKHFCLHNKYPQHVTDHLERLQREARKHGLSLPKCNPTLFHFFPKKK
jgi:hypothetical protein